MLQFLAVSEESLALIHQAMQSDQTMLELQAVIKTGWPEKRDSLSGNLQNYFNFRGELPIQDGFVLKGERLVIPAAAKDAMKRKVHASHIAIRGCL